MPRCLLLFFGNRQLSEGREAPIDILDVSRYGACQLSITPGHMIPLNPYLVTVIESLYHRAAEPQVIFNHLSEIFAIC